ncbi:zinc finger MYM-type protein 1-like [Myzus persicae]|uniref:zinc finger MYM-type protein 1-like n=1 Tax=Myzus persicae TaxID=13164 RepID=UPI000B92FFEB|nr:zinc finger MYM-type protein 1-like [Myzus persicae]
MSGSVGGVQAKFRQAHPLASQAIYVHCMAHKLNLVIVDMCSHVKDVRNLFNGLKALYVHFSHPSKDFKLTKMQQKLGLKINKLTQLSESRWVCRYKSCKALITNYQAILKTLDGEINEQKSKDVAHAIGVRATIVHVKFIVYLFISHEVLLSINILSVQLQAKGTTLGKSGNLVKGVIRTLENNRSDKHFSELWAEIEIFCSENDISIDNSHQGPKRRKKEPSRLKGYAVTVTTAADSEDCFNKNDFDAENYWKLNAFFVIMDTIISNMKRRFSTESLQIATSADCLMQFDFNGSLHLIDHYKDLFEINKCDLKNEMVVFKNSFCNNEKTDNFSAIQENVSKKVFPNLYRMVQVANILPISSVTSERSFSAMRRINTRVDKNGNTTAYNVLEDVNLTYSEIKNHTIEVETITDCTAT